MGQYVLDKIPKWKISKITLRDLKLLELYEFQQCTYQWVPIHRPVRFSMVRAIFLDYRKSITDVSIENVIFHSFVEFADILSSLENLKKVNIFNIEVKCLECKKNFENFFKNLKNIKIRECKVRIRTFFERNAENAQIDFEWSAEDAARQREMQRNLPIPYQMPNLNEIVLFNPRANLPVPSRVELLLKNNRRFISSNERKNQLMKIVRSFFKKQLIVYN